MNLKAMRLIWVLFLFSSSFLRGGEKPPIQLVADATFLSQYVAHGLDLSDGGPVIQGTVIANHVLIPNLEVGFIYSYTLDRDDRIWDETGPGIRYTGVLFEDKAYALKSLSFLYYWNYPHYDVAFDKDFEPIDEDHFQGLKFEQTFFLPELIRLGKVALVPSYKLSHWRTIKDEMFEEGFQHEFGLEAIVPVESLKGLPVSIKGTANYHDGVLGVEEGWTHYTLQTYAVVPWKGLFLKPGLNYQWSEEPTVNKEDEFWVSLSVTKLF
ncbi:MAG TPA: hypothetical protein VJ952_04070 [Opitutales bacterium]|nr:hypothetical protein [Opitutales bacterium]